MLTRTLYIALSLAVAGSVWFYRGPILSIFNHTSDKSKINSDESIVEVDLLEVAIKPMKRVFTFAGVVSNRKLIKLKPERPGQIKYLNPNTDCKNDELLIEFSNNSEKALVLKQKALHNRALENLKRYKSRISQNSSSSSEAEYLTYKTEVDAAKAELLRAEADLSKTQITAPFNGRLGIYNYGISEGAHVTQSETLVTYTSEGTDLIIDFVVSEGEVMYIKEGKEISIISISYGKQALSKGTIERIDPAGDASYSIKVRAGIKYDPNIQLLPGFSAKIFCPADTEEMLPTVDERAAQEVNGKLYINRCVPTEQPDVFIVQKTSLADLGQRSGGQIAVNLKPGEIYTYERVIDGAKVKRRIKEGKSK